MIHDGNYSDSLPFSIALCAQPVSVTVLCHDWCVRSVFLCTSSQGGALHSVRVVTSRALLSKTLKLQTNSFTFLVFGKLYLTLIISIPGAFLPRLQLLHCY